MIYDIYPTEKAPTTFAVSVNGAQVTTLTGGNVFEIYQAFCDLRRFDERRADDFMHGVIHGLMYPIRSGTALRLTNLTIDLSIKWPPMVQQPKPQAVEKPAEEEPAQKQNNAGKPKR